MLNNGADFALLAAVAVHLITAAVVDELSGACTATTAGLGAMALDMTRFTNGVVSDLPHGGGAAAIVLMRLVAHGVVTVTLGAYLAVRPEL